MAGATAITACAPSGSGSAGRAVACRSPAPPPRSAPPCCAGAGRPSLLRRPTRSLGPVRHEAHPAQAQDAAQDRPRPAPPARLAPGRLAQADRPLAPLQAEGRAGLGRRETLHQRRDEGCPGARQVVAAQGRRRAPAGLREEKAAVTRPAAEEKAVPVLYLDLDGTVRQGKDDALGRFVNGPGDVVVFPEAVEMMRRWKAGGGRIIGVSNQGGVSLGIVSYENVAAAMTETQRQCENLFDKIAFCVHHPGARTRSEEHTSELQSHSELLC